MISDAFARGIFKWQLPERAAYPIYSWSDLTENTAPATKAGMLMGSALRQPGRSDHLAPRLLVPRDRRQEGTDLCQHTVPGLPGGTRVVLCCPVGSEMS